MTEIINPDFREVDEPLFRASISPTRVRERIIYDPNTGIAIHAAVKVRPERSRLDNSWNAQFAGKELKSINQMGYKVGAIDMRIYLVSRLAWAYMTGAWPSKLIDHIDRNKTNDRWCNLREADYSQNAMNKASKPGLSGVRGVTLRSSGRFSARIKVRQRELYLGSFDTLEDAEQAYKEAAESEFGNFVRKT